MKFAKCFGFRTCEDKYFLAKIWISSCPKIALKSENRSEDSFCVKTISNRELACARDIIHDRERSYCSTVQEKVV